MTENEAIKDIKRQILEIESDDSDITLSTESLYMAIKAIDELQQYRAIGTVEELEWCKDASHWKGLFKDKLEQYEAIGTVEKCRVAVERMKPKKPFFNGANYECPNCYTRPYADDAEDKKPMLCDICGQILDWQ